MQKQPTSLLRLKAHIVEHIHESQTHKALLEKKSYDNEREKERLSRAYKIGMNIGRIRYNGIKQGRSYLDLEKTSFWPTSIRQTLAILKTVETLERLLTAHIDTIMKNKIAQNISNTLRSTGKKCPVGLIADKITPNKRTGHIIGIIVPVPDNPTE